MKWFINGEQYAPDRFAIEIERGAVEIWEIVNDMASMPHPMHIHGFQFHVLERMTMEGAMPSPFGPLLGADGRLPTDRGWKDTVLVWPGETVKVAIDFSHPFEGEQRTSFTATTSHEDEGMMVNYRIL